jgi:hypothetical protein
MEFDLSDFQIWTSDPGVTYREARDDLAATLGGVVADAALQNLAPADHERFIADVARIARERLPSGDAEHLERRIAPELRLAA